MTWMSRTSRLNDCLSRLCFQDRRGAGVDQDQAFSLWTESAIRIRRSRNTVFLVGNGASASMASHFSADLCKNARIRTEVFTDLSQITAMANDIGFDHVFSIPLGFRMSPGDMLVAISSSGESPNILNAVKTARELGGMVVTLSGMNPGNTLRKQGDLNGYLEAETYGLAETGHAAILHFWMDKVSEIKD